MTTPERYMSREGKSGLKADPSTFLKILFISQTNHVPTEWRGWNSPESYKAYQ